MKFSKYAKSIVSVSELAFGGEASPTSGIPSKTQQQTQSTQSQGAKSQSSFSLLNNTFIQKLLNITFI